MMESGNIGDWEFNINALSDAELAQKLHQLGATIGPITGMYLLWHATNFMRRLAYFFV